MTGSAITAAMDGTNTNLAARLGSKTQSLPLLGDAARFQGFTPYAETIGMPGGLHFC